jgi:AcrR family transcriptional regulator
MATRMNKADLLAAMAAHVRLMGLAGASLRPLAKAAGTSDRMLIYHFGTKAALLTALLAR